MIEAMLSDIPQMIHDNYMAVLYVIAIVGVLRAVLAFYRSIKCASRRR